MPVEGFCAETGTWKSWGGAEELTSVLLGRKEGEQAMPDLVEGACSMFCPSPIPPGALEAPGSGFSRWAVRAGMWAASAPRAGGVGLATGLQRVTDPHTGPEGGQDASAMWFGPAASWPAVGSGGGLRARGSSGPLRHPGWEMKVPHTHAKQGPVEWYQSLVFIKMGSEFIRFLSLNCQG